MNTSASPRYFPLPENFDPVKHHREIELKVKQQLGGNWKISHIDTERKALVVVRENSITSVAGETGDQKMLELVEGTKKSDADRIAVKFEELNPGFSLTKFEPFANPPRATMTRLDQDTKRAREAIAEALRVKPWDIQIRRRTDSGFDFGLPPTYAPSKHFDNLDEVAKDIIGNEGWYVTANAKSLRASLIPSDPPTFPGVIKFPVDAEPVKFERGSREWAKIDIGHVLPAPGQHTYDKAVIDLESQSHSQLGGLPGGGKSVTINGFITKVLTAGVDLMIVDVPDKAVDFEWCKDFVMPGGWGCDSYAHAATTLALAYEEGQRRAAILSKHSVQNYNQLPPEAEEIRPLVIIVDELSGLLAKMPIYKSLPSNHPMRVEAEQRNLTADLISAYVHKIPAEHRFVGTKVFGSTQIASKDTGITPKLRGLLGNKALMGLDPSASQMNLMFSAPDSIPRVPDNVKTDEDASRGVGMLHPDGRSPAVFKSYFATTEALREYVLKYRKPTVGRLAPTDRQVDEVVPNLSDDNGDSASVKNRKQMEAEAMTDPETGEKLSSFEYANKQKQRSVRKSEADAASGETAAS